MAAVAERPLRVVSLLPSATDTVVALGLAHLLVGRSHEARPRAAHCAAVQPALTPARAVRRAGGGVGAVYHGQ